MKWKNTLLAYENDINNRNLWEWVKAHTSFMKPLHRYDGVLIISKEKIIFTGEDKKDNKVFNFEISVADITDIYYGFDEVFSRWEDRAAPWNKPLRLKYNNGRGSNTIYLFANFHHKHGMRTSSNKEVYKNLIDL